MSPKRCQKQPSLYGLQVANFAASNWGCQDHESSPCEKSIYSEWFTNHIVTTLVKIHKSIWTSSSLSSEQDQHSWRDFSICCFIHWRVFKVDGCWLQTFLSYDNKTNTSLIVVGEYSLKFGSELQWYSQLIIFVVWAKSISHLGPWCLMNTVIKTGVLSSRM